VISLSGSGHFRSGMDTLGLPRHLNARLSCCVSRHLVLLKCGAPVAHDEAMDIARPEKVPLYQGQFFTQVDHGNDSYALSHGGVCDAS
jgi:hypothetical protein